MSLLERSDMEGDRLFGMPHGRLNGPALGKTARQGRDYDIIALSVFFRQNINGKSQRHAFNLPDVSQCHNRFLSHAHVGCNVLFRPVVISL